MTEASESAEELLREARHLAEIRRTSNSHRSVTLALLALALLTGCAGDDDRATSKPPSQAGSMVEVNGHRLYVSCEGSGSPTIVLESGFGTSSTSWRTVVPELARVSRVCSYDRAGIELSAIAGTKLPASDTRTIRDQVDDLEELLENAEIAAPYVLVGHSWGGQIVQVFASEHADEVAAVVLVDSSHPDQEAAFRSAFPQQAEPQPARDPAANLERLDFEASNAENREAELPRDLPLVVVTAGRYGPEGEPPAASDRRSHAVWLRLQRQLAALSTKSIHVIATRSGHFIQDFQGQPELVVTAVKAAVAAARSDGDLPSCEAVFRGPDARCEPRAR